MRNQKSGGETKGLLSSSLKELMKSKALEKISIRELTSYCGLNRQTFYYHFDNIYELLTWTIQHDAMELFREHEDVLIWQEDLLKGFYYIEENREFCLCALRSRGYESLKQFFYTYIQPIIRRMVSEFAESLQNSDEYSDFLTHFYTISLAALIESWLLGEIGHTPEELIQMINRLLTEHRYGAEQLHCKRYPE